MYPWIIDHLVSWLSNVAAALFYFVLLRIAQQQVQIEQTTVSLADTSEKNAHLFESSGEETFDIEPRANQSNNKTTSTVIFEYTGQNEHVPKDVTSVIFHHSVTEVKDDAFKDCIHLKNVMFNDKLHKIGNRAFGGCISLQKINNFPSTLIEIGDHAFKQCETLRNVVFNEGLYKIGGAAFSGCKSLSYLKFPSTLNEIDAWTFFHCEKLTEVVFNEGLRNIRLSAFSGCSSLQCINLPSTITNVGEWSFGNCINLTTIEFSNGLTKIGRKAFCNCSSLEGISLPSTVVEIGDEAFQDCTLLRNVVLNDGLQKIGRRSFQGCIRLENINTFPATLREVGSHAFLYCQEMRGPVILNKDLHVIFGGAFQHCRALQSVTFTSTMSEASGLAFQGCYSLREMLLNDAIYRILPNVFFGCIRLDCFYFPSIAARFEAMVHVGQNEIESKVNEIPGVHFRGGELCISTLMDENKSWETSPRENMEMIQESLDRVVRLIAYYELKEATTIFELAIWRSNIIQAGEAYQDREAFRTEVPGPVKDAILQYLS